MNSAQSHILECARESGFDLLAEAATSCEQTDADGLETWYQEAAIFAPWRAWKPGYAKQGRGFSREEAIADWKPQP